MVAFNMTSEQWLTNVICPLIVGIFLLIITWITIPIFRWFKFYVFKWITEWCFEIWWRIKRIFMTKEKRKQQDEIIQAFHDAAERLDSLNQHFSGKEK